MALNQVKINLYFTNGVTDSDTSLAKWPRIKTTSIKMKKVKENQMLWVQVAMPMAWKIAPTISTCTGWRNSLDLFSKKGPCSANFATLLEKVWLGNLNLLWETVILREKQLWNTETRNAMLCAEAHILRKASQTSLERSLLLSTE